MTDDFKRDPKLARLFEETDTQQPPFAYFQELVARQRRASRLEALGFSLVAVVVLVAMAQAVIRGQAAIVVRFLGLVWFCLPWILPVAAERERMKNAEN